MLPCHASVHHLACTGFKRLHAGVQSVLPDSTLLLLAQERPADASDTLRVSEIGRAEDSMWSFTPHHAEQVSTSVLHTLNNLPEILWSYLCIHQSCPAD